MNDNRTTGTGWRDPRYNTAASGQSAQEIASQPSWASGSASRSIAPGGGNQSEFSALQSSQRTRLARSTEGSSAHGSAYASSSVQEDANLRDSRSFASLVDFSRVASRTPSRSPAATVAGAAAGATTSSLVDRLSIHGASSSPSSTASLNPAVPISYVPPSSSRPPRPRSRAEGSLAASSSDVKRASVRRGMTNEEIQREVASSIMRSEVLSQLRDGNNTLINIAESSQGFCLSTLSRAINGRGELTDYGRKLFLRLGDDAVTSMEKVCRDRQATFPLPKSSRNRKV